MMHSIAPINTKNAIWNARRTVFHSRWFYLGLFVLAICIVLAFTLDMQYYTVSLISGLLGIALASYFILRITLRPITTPEMVEVAGDIRFGAQTYLRRQIRTILFVTPFLPGCCIGFWIGKRRSRRFLGC
jgi:Inorganic pyrophosphatase